MAKSVYFNNIEYLNVYQLKALHKIEITRLRSMIDRYEKASPRSRYKVDIQQLSFAIEEQKKMLDELCYYIDKLESLSTTKR